MRNIKTIAVLMLIMILYTGSAYAVDRVSLAFLYGSTESIDLIDRTNGAINHISPTCFDLDDKGNLVVTSNLTHTFVDQMHEREIVVTPFLSNHWSRQKGVAAVNNAENLSDQIVQAIEEYNLDGVNVDIENLTENHRDLLTNLVMLLNQKLPEEKILSVSVAANPTYKTTGWQGSYDYVQLGKNSDYLLIMTYDEHSQGGPEGPVSSHDFVEHSIYYAMDFVENDKLVLGIPFFGRYWKHDLEEDTYSGGKAVVIGAVPNLVAKHEGEIEYDETIGEAKYTFVVNNEEMSSKINGEELEDGEYVLWFPNQEAIKDKLELVNKYNLLGSGVWALGQEKSEVWAYYKEDLNRVERLTGIRLANSKIEEHREEYATVKVDLNPINDAIHKARRIIKEFAELEFVNAVDISQVENEEVPHKHEKIIDEVEFSKTKEEMSVEAKQKVVKNKSKKELHFKRMEKKY